MQGWLPNPYPYPNPNPAPAPAPAAAPAPAPAPNPNPTCRGGCRRPPLPPPRSQPPGDMYAP